MALNLSSVTEHCFGCIVLSLSCFVFIKSMETKLPEIKAISIIDGALTSLFFFFFFFFFFWQVKFVPKKPNLTCHIINNVHKEGLKRMCLMD